MSFFVVDDQAHVHPKHQALIRRGLAGDVDALAAGYLWVMMGSRLRSSYQDGRFDRFDLFAVMPDQRVLRMAEILVEVGLWHDRAHCCERCEPPPEGAWVFHDWGQWSQRTGEQDRARRALQTERKDTSLHDAMWARDGLTKGRESDPDRARCAYCQTIIFRDTRKGDLAPEMDHVFGKAIGLDGVAVSCRACNRAKGNRSASKAGLSFHPTPPHAAALARRAERRSRPGEGPADLLEMVWETQSQDDVNAVVDCGSRPDGFADSVPAAAVVDCGSRPDGFADSVPAAAVVDCGSRPDGFADSVPAAAVVDCGSRPDGFADSVPADAQGSEKLGLAEGGGSSVPVSGRVHPAERPREPQQEPGGSSVPSCASKLEIGPQTPADGSEGVHGGLREEPVGSDRSVPCREDGFLEGLARAYAHGPVRARTRTGPCAPVRTAAHALSRPAGQGKAGQGQEEAGQGKAGQGQEEAGQGKAGQGRAGHTGGSPPKRRRRRRGKRRQASCGVHGDVFPCRLCEEEIEG